MSFFGDKNFLIEVAKGNVPGHKLAALFGRNPGVGTSEEDVWRSGGVLAYPTTGETWEVVSTSIDDTAAGTGAQTVRVSYLDDNYVAQTEDKTLNGVTAVTFTATDAFRPVGVVVLTAGSGAANDGVITVQVSGAGNPRMSIGAGDNVDHDSHYTVEAGKTAYILSTGASVSKGKDAIINFKATTSEDGLFYSLVPMNLYQQAFFQSGESPSNGIPEKSDIKAVSVSENASTPVSINFKLLIVDN